jgi:hypothetical protein
MKHVKLAILALTLFLGGMTSAARADWVIRDSVRDAVTELVHTSPSLADMRDNQVPDVGVYSANDPKKKLMPIYELVACLQLTNPATRIAVDWGGGYDIDMDRVQFPGGIWDVHLRFEEVVQINLLEKYKVLLVDRVIVGTRRMRDLDQRVRLLRQLTRACYAKP